MSVGTAPTIPVFKSPERAGSVSGERLQRMKRRWYLRGRYAAGAFAAMVVVVIALWVGIHRISWLGPLLADTARAVFGPTVVARIEDTAYALDDAWNRFWRGDEAPKPYWDVPPQTSSHEVGPAPAPSSSAPVLSTFRPVDVKPMHASSYAKGDGAWVAVRDARRPGAAAVMFKTLLHPDRARGWAAVAIVAIDARRTRLQLVPGVTDPKATERDARDLVRTGLVPAEERETLLAAFNGGFKTEHGTLGIHAAGVTIVGPQRWGCTIGRRSDDSIVMGPWKELAPMRASLIWWRQTPSCLVDRGVFTPGVLAEGNINWGSTVDGDTIIRRSAIGLGEDGTTVYVGISDATSAGSIGSALHHAGAHTVAQLDVNWSFPKFLFYELDHEDPAVPSARPLCPGFEYDQTDYVTKPSMRDFFYVVRASE